MPGPPSLRGIVENLKDLVIMGMIFTLISSPLFLFLLGREVYLKVKKRKKDQVSFWYALFVVLPLFAFLSKPIENFGKVIGRKSVISNARPIIQAIEMFKKEKSVYPKDLGSLVPAYLNIIPDPGVMGTRGFGYKPTQDTYEVYFTDCMSLGFNWEVVIYNPKDQQKGEGDYPTLYSTGHPHWRYYWFD
jgi:hypothetical protein